MHRRTLLLGALALGLSPWAGGCARGGTGAVAYAPGAGPTLPAPPPGLFAPLSDRLVAALATPTENLAFSPWSIGTVLAMVRGGARGATADQLDDVLGVDPAALAASVNTTWRALTAGRARLSGANAIWAQTGYGWEKPYLDHLADFGAPLAERNITADPDGARREVNAWVGEQTRGKIPDLIPAGLVTGDTRMILANALHLAASWAQPLFDADDHPFATPSGVRAVPWLVGGGRWPWLDADGRTATVIPCEEREFLLVVVAPRPGEPMADALTHRSLRAVATAPAATVSLALPRFTIDTRPAVADALRATGVADAFDRDRADFAGMTSREKLFLSFLVHQAVVAVDAKGIEATAATAAGMEASGMPSDVRELVLDRPFGYALVHGATLTPLFVGVVADPAA